MRAVEVFRTRVDELLENLEPNEMPAALGEIARAKIVLLTRLRYSKTNSGKVAKSSDRILSMPEVAERLGVSLYTAREMGRSGKLPVLKIGRHVGVRESTFKRVLEEREAH
jgi:excisionase family DNA binding protein